MHSNSYHIYIDEFLFQNTHTQHTHFICVCIDVLLLLHFANVLFQRCQWLRRLNRFRIKLNVLRYLPFADRCMEIRVILCNFIRCVVVWRKDFINDNNKLSILYIECVFAIFFCYVKCSTSTCLMKSYTSLRVCEIW